MRLLCLTLLLLFLSPGRAETLHGTVTGIADGDTLYVLDANRREHRIRLLGIDAPELGQAFGEASKKSLKQHAYRQAVRVEWQKRDQHGRLLGKVMLSGNRDVNLYQLTLGMAWWNRKYADDQAPADAIRYREAEYGARKKRLGLWSQANPVPPWRWRHANPRKPDQARP